MPALNTPQFGWVKSRLKHKAQPVPPVFEPEVGARAVVWASDHRRREVWVGGPTVEAIVGNKIAPGLLDEYLGKTGYKAQQTSEPENPNRPDNLWSPVDEDRDYGSHGTFDNQARPMSFQLWADLNRRLIGLGIGAAALAAGVVTAAARSSSSETRRRAERDKKAA
jgi:hypothetical protein